MKLFRTSTGAVIQRGDQFFAGKQLDWNALLGRPDIHHHLTTQIDAGHLPPASAPTQILAPVQDQEVWAAGAGVTYLRSREARVEESKSAGGGSFYDRVYAAERPELFFKSAGHRVIATGGNVRIRRDSHWNVPEPELTLLIASTGIITGYTVGNDMSSRDIEGENPLYLPQAKIYDGACALGPCILLQDQPLPPDTPISIQITRRGTTAFSATTEISRIKRTLPSLADYLCRELAFPHGVFLLTGTGIIPPDNFTLQPADQITITIPPIGTLVNTVA